MSEAFVVRSNITTEAGFTEGQVMALRAVFSELYDELEELRDSLEFVNGELEVR